MNHDDAKTRRKHLDEFQDAHTQIELAEQAICTLERMSGAWPPKLVKTLKRLQQKALTRMDAAAEKLGAPYGS